MTHTPGPWEARPNDGQIVLNGSNCYHIQEIFNDVGGFNPADIRLMAAAPELLAVLKDLWGWEDVIEEWDRELHGRMKAAISKAEGRE